MIMHKRVRLNYTTINHEARVSLGLSITEYCVFDLIHHLATNPKNSQMGWCYAKKETLASYLDLSRATVFRAIKKGLTDDLLEKHPDQPALIKATSNWYEVVMIKGESHNETPGRKKRDTPSQDETPACLKTRPNKDSDKDSDNSTVEAKTSRRKKGMSSIGDVLEQYQLPLLGEYVSTQWQAEAIRLWHELGLPGEPSRQFFKHVKLAFKRKQRGKLTNALSYCRNARGVNDVEKLFYWRCANDPA
jgi:hypothetical protein